MKRVISVILTVLMIAALFSVMAVPSSAENNELVAVYDYANDGDLLYKVKFNQADGCYNSHEIIRDPKNTGVLSFSEDGYEVKVSLNASTDTGKLWYGDTIDGLTLGEGYKYTIKYKIKNDNGEYGTGNNGFFINSDEGATTAENSYGAYGNLCKEDSFYSLFRYGTKTNGMFLCSGSYIKFSTMEYKPQVDEDGFVDCQVEIDGYTYYLYINGNLFDATEIMPDDVAVAGKLAIIFYTYSSGGSLKDVEIYKGLTLSNIETDAPTDTEEPTPSVTEESKTETPTDTEAPSDTDAPKQSETEVSKTDAPDPSETEAPKQSETEVSKTDAAKTDAPKASQTDAPKTDAPAADKKSCGGIAGIASVLAVVCGAFGTALIAFKKH